MDRKTTYIEPIPVTEPQSYLYRTETVPSPDIWYSTGLLNKAQKIYKIMVFMQAQNNKINLLYICFMQALLVEHGTKQIQFTSVFSHSHIIVDTY